MFGWGFARRPPLARITRPYAERVTFDQAEFAIRCEWGLRGVRELAPISEVTLLVDVLSFTTALDIAAARGAVVFPYPLKNPAAANYAEALDAQLASAVRSIGYSLSPASLESLPAQYRLVLPSPNGAALAFAAGNGVVLAGCLRNASAVAGMAARLGSTFAVIPAGETWDTGELRPSLEDCIGAGALIASLPGARSPEAELAAASFERFRGDLAGALRKSASGKELLERGFARDLELAAAYDVSEHVPRLRDRAFTGEGGLSS
jgi:2-phosphosulfolactate phosphatase